MDEQHAIAKHYAVLIGIDAYPIQPLNSCVSDIKRIEGFLKAKAISANIQTFTARRSSNPNELMPVEKTEHWPTCRNIISAFEKVASHAKRGDFVYIHYSGHGQRMITSTPFEFSNTSTGDLALVLLGNDGTGRSNTLKGPTLAGHLKRMVEKGLIVTLVLDCCFSAAVYRTDTPEVRYLPPNQQATIHPQNQEHSIIDRNTRSTNRDASMRDNWLVDPDGYAILAACGPHENAKGGSEIEENGKRYGALSSFLFSALSDHGLGSRHKDIHRYICAKLWEYCVEQNPVLYGNENQAFFGPVISSCGERAFSIVERRKTLKLRAGQAHGVREGDRFAVFRSGSREAPYAEDCFATVTYAGPLTSEFKLSDSQCDVRRCIAELLTCSYLVKFPIRLAPDLPHHSELLNALRERSLGVCVDMDQAPVFQVVLNDDEYEFLDKFCQKISNLPAMPSIQTDPQRIGELLEHLARFEMVKDLTNDLSTDSFRESFDIQIVRGGESFGPGQEIEVRHNTIVTLVMENRGDTIFYVYAYCLGPCWEVKGILRGTYVVIHPRKYQRYGDQDFTGISKSKVKMNVPPVLQEERSCQDVIKVFVTSQPSSFGSLELPILNGVTKICAEDRTPQPGGYESEDWVALNFPIRTVL